MVQAQPQRFWTRFANADPRKHAASTLSLHKPAIGVNLGGLDAQRLCQKLEDIDKGAATAAVANGGVRD